MVHADAEVRVLRKHFYELRDLGVFIFRPLIDGERQFAAEFRRNFGKPREVDLGIVCFDETEVFLFELHAQFADREVNVIVRVVGKLHAEFHPALEIHADGGGEFGQRVADAAHVQNGHQTSKAVLHQGDAEPVCGEIDAIKQAEVIHDVGADFRGGRLFYAMGARAARRAMQTVAVGGFQTFRTLTTAGEGTDEDAEFGKIESVQSAVRGEGSQSVGIHVEIKSVVEHRDEEIVVFQKFDLGVEVYTVGKIEVGADARDKLAFEIFVHVKGERRIQKYAADTLGKDPAELLHKVGEIVTHIGELVAEIRFELHVNVIEGGDIAVGRARPFYDRSGDHRLFAEGDRDVRYFEIDIGVLVADAFLFLGGGIKGDARPDLDAVFGLEIHLAGGIEVDHGFGTLAFHDKPQHRGKQSVRKGNGEFVADIQAAEDVADQFHHLFGREGRRGCTRHRGDITFRRKRFGKVVFQADAVHKLGQRGAIRRERKPRRIHEDGAFAAGEFTVPNGQDAIALGEVRNCRRVGFFVNIQCDLHGREAQASIRARKEIRNTDGIKENVCVHLDVQPARERLFHSQHTGEFAEDAAQRVADVALLQATGITRNGD